MSKYLKLIEELKEFGSGKMKVFGNSMLPIIKSSTLLTFKKQDEYQIDDIVFCRVKGRTIDAHKITKKSDAGYMIANNKGYENGWTKQVYAKAILGELKGEIIYANY